MPSLLRKYKLTIVTLLALVISVICAQKIVQDWNPEFHFWSSCFEKKRTEIGALRATKKPLVIFAGGSTCAFSIDPSALGKDSNFSFYNFGGAVPMGANYLVSSALNECQAGDTLVLALEPVFLTSDESDELKTLGVTMSLRDQKLGYRNDGPSKLEALRASRPGASFTSTMIGKKLLGMPSYRYSMENFREGGRLSTLLRREALIPAKRPPHTGLSASGKKLLGELLNLASKKQVNLLYTLPWTLTAPEAVESHRAENQKFLESLGEYVTVIHDPYYGVHTDPDFFADTLNHLSDVGASTRTLAIKSSLMKLLEEMK